MTKMYGEISGEEVMNLFHKISEEIDANRKAGNHQHGDVMIPKTTFVAIIGEYKDCLNRKFFFELGRSMQLQENQESIRKMVPEKYRQDFEDGIHERKVVEQLMDNKCNTCEKVKRFVSVRGLRGKVFIDRNKKEVKSESSS